LLLRIIPAQNFEGWIEHLRAYHKTTAHGCRETHAMGLLSGRFRFLLLAETHLGKT
jgi:hypothetical protein